MRSVQPKVYLRALNNYALEANLLLRDSSTSWLASGHYKGPAG